MDKDVKQQWMNIMNPKRLKPNLERISLYITIYEMLEDTVVQKPRDFYTIVDEIDEHEYKAKVLDLYEANKCPLINKNSRVLISSLLWWCSQAAISSEDIELFSRCKNRRNAITHEMFSTIASGLDEGFYEDFIKMYDLFCKIERWWILNYEAPLNPDFDNIDYKIDKDEVMSGNMVVLSLIMDIVDTGSNELYVDACKKLGIDVED